MDGGRSRTERAAVVASDEMSPKSRFDMMHASVGFWFKMIATSSPTTIVVMWIN
jgi:hypothetical protein